MYILMKGVSSWRLLLSVCVKTKPVSFVILEAIIGSIIVVVVLKFIVYYFVKHIFNQIMRCVFFVRMDKLCIYFFVDHAPWRYCCDGFYRFYVVDIEGLFFEDIVELL